MVAEMTVYGKKRSGGDYRLADETLVIREIRYALSGESVSVGGAAPARKSLIDVATPAELGRVIVDAVTPEPDAPSTRRERIAAACKAAEGLWKDRADIPKDGVEFQEQLRAEWR
jgi:hypothetical protein